MKAVLFDVDGTLLDTREYVFQGFEHAINENGFPAKTREELAATVGLILRDGYRILYPDREIEPLVESQRRFYKKNVELASVFPGIPELLASLQKNGILLSAASSRVRETVNPTLELNGLLEFFGAVIGREDTKRHKPDPAPFRLAAERLKVSPTDAWVVGDAPFDIESGNAGGFTTVGVTYGFGTSEAVSKAKPDHLVPDVAGLRHLLLG